MRKAIVFSFVLLFILGASLANAAPNVASLSNRGSVLVFPMIDTSNVWDGIYKETYIKISNDANKAVNLKCYWVKVDGPVDVPQDCIEAGINQALIPPKQSPMDFGLTLTRNQPVMFAASTGDNDHYDPLSVTVTPFGKGNKGYLYCWAVDADNAQINWNFLTGEAVVVNPSFMHQTAMYEYNAWAFGARAGSQGAKVGTPGTILLDGAKYDTTPQYLLFNFPAVGYDGFKNLKLVLVQGSQNFRTMAKSHHVTKANFSLWNENESPFSGAAACTFCWREGYLDGVSNGQFFTWDGLNSSVGRFRVQGVASAGCVLDLTPAQIFNCFGAGTTIETYNTGLLGLAIQSYQLSDSLTVNAGHTGGQILTDKIVFDPDQP